MGAQLSYSGSTDIPSGVSTLTVTGLGLSFTPTSASVHVRKPDAASYNIVATVYGTPTADGFTVEFTATTDSALYVLDWIVWAETIAIDTSDTLAITYEDLCADVSAFLGYPAAASQSAAQIAEVDRYVQAGVRQFYYPPAAQGVEPGYEWGFLKPTSTLTTVESTSTYDLPTTFGRMAGFFHYAATVYRAPIVIVSEAKIQTLIQQSTDNGIPRYAAIRFKQEYGVHGQVQEVVFWPPADDAYVLTYRFEAYTGKLSATNNCPLGGMRYAELLTESCIAVAEQRANDETGIHYERFIALLIAGVAQDRRGGGQLYGPMGGDSDNFNPDCVLRSGDVTYKGVTW